MSITFVSIFNSVIDRLWFVSKKTLKHSYIVVWDCVCTAQHFSNRRFSYLSCWWHHSATPKAQPHNPAIGPNSATSRTPTDDQMSLAIIYLLYNFFIILRFVLYIMFLNRGCYLDHRQWIQHPVTLPCPHEILIAALSTHLGPENNIVKNQLFYCQRNFVTHLTFIVSLSSEKS